MKNPLSYLAVIFVALAGLIAFFDFGAWKRTLYIGDSSHYYLHVVSFFVNQDVGDYDKTITSLIEQNPGSQDIRNDPFGIRPTEKSRMYIKYTLGVPIMETPFFLIAHAYAHVSGKYEPTGWTLPYLLAVGLAPLIYVIIGLFILAGVLRRYFNDGVVAAALLAVGLATNLFYQSTIVAMSHSFLFFDYCLLIYLTIRFYDRSTVWRALAIGFVVGLIAITRVPEVLSALIPILWGVTGVKALRARVGFFGGNPSFTVAAIIGFLAGFGLQFVYWYYVSGHLVFDPYQGEGFNFLNPKFYYAMFSYVNGWLVYTPVMSFAFLGLFLLRKNCKEVIVPLVVFVFLHMYVHYSYYAYTYYPGMGQRPMVETYALLSFPLAAVFSWASKNKLWRLISILFLGGFILLNLFQTWQISRGILLTERANKAYYWAIFGKTGHGEAAFKAFDTSQRQPDADKLELKKRIYLEDFEEVSSAEVDTFVAYSGKFSFVCNKEVSDWKDELAGEEFFDADWLKIGLQGFFRAEDRVWHRDQCAEIAIRLYNKDGKRKKRVQMSIQPHIGNDDWNIWRAGEPGMWDEASFYLRVPNSAREDWTMELYFFNPARSRVYVDDVYVETYSER